MSAQALSSARAQQERRTGRRAPVRTVGCVGHLNRQWEELNQLPATIYEVAAWVRSADGLLDGCATLVDVQERTYRLNSAETDVVLRMLIARAQAGEETAGRAVLQVMLGAICRMALRGYRRPRGYGEDEVVLQRAVGHMWELIINYPLERRSKVTANLTMDLLHRLTSESQAEQRRLDVEVSIDDVRLQSLSGEQPASSYTEVLGVLAWGVDAGVISKDEASMLVRVYAPGPEDEASPRAVADAMGINWPTLRQRCRRVVRRLAYAVAS